MIRRPGIPLLAQALLMLAVVATGLLAPTRPASAHEFTLEAVINAFVAIEPREAHVVIRMPLYILKPVKFPLSGREIDLAHAEPAIAQALASVGREITLRENGVPLAPSSGTGRLSLPSDRSFATYQAAVAHVAQPMANGTAIYADQGYFDAHFTYPITAPNSRFTIQTAIAPEFKDHLKLVIRYMPLGEESRGIVITSRSGEVALNPSWYQAAAGFVRLGIAHILGGVDHLLFLVCLVIPLRGLREILGIITAFTAAHSITLFGSALDLGPEGAWFPPFVETMIAASIVYMAFENVVGADLRRRWLLTGMFGLVHGFGFSYGLKESLQFAGKHLVVSLLSFNIGIEIGQLLVLGILLPILAVLVRHASMGRVGTIVISVVVAHTGWHWMIERGDVLLKQEWPTVDASALMTLGRWVAAILLAAGGASLIARRLRTGRLSSSPRIGPLRPASFGSRLRASAEDAVLRLPGLGASRKRSGS